MRERLMDDIRCVVLDVDGVLTDGRLWYAAHARPLRAFHVHDGLAVEWFQRLGGVVAILSGKKSAAIESRAAEIGIRHVVQGSEDKLADLKELLSKLKVEPSETAMVADDLPDLPALQFCGHPIAVANAVAEVKTVARYVTEKRGGDGAVREAIEHLLRAAGRWTEVLAHYSGESAAEA
jgi:3-deoxy-D-manno-octulosonate 8-phosphate phosphatase (KDO 8-P phosphatase)